MENKKTLGLLTPERSKAPAGTFLTDPRDVEEWLQSLPMANISESARQIFKTIVDFNRIEVPASTRIKIAEKLKHPILYISDNLRKEYFDNSLPLGPKNQKIAVLNRELYSELATSYKIFIEQMISASAEEFDQKLLIIAIHRALRYLFREIYYSAIVYEPVPNGIWQEVHRLFAYAELNKINKLQIKNAEDGDHTNSIEEIYIQILLFSIASPYRLRVREAQLVMDNLRDWCSHCSLYLPNTIKQDEYSFICRLWSDEPPSHINLQTKEASKRSRVLHVRKLVVHLRNTFDELPIERDSHDAGSEQGKLTRQFLHKLIRSFSSAPKREFVRTKLNFKLQTAVTLHDIHRLISHKTTLEPEAEMNAMERHRAVELDWLTSTGKSYELRSKLYDLNQANVLPGSRNPFEAETEEFPGHNSISNYHDSAIPAWAVNNDSVEVETFSCKTINESAGGYCINWSGPNTPKIKIGEILGIQSATNQNQFGIGVSRWLLNGPNKTLQLGMEILSASSKAVVVYPHLKQPSPESCSNGLLLPESRAVGQAACLLLPPRKFKVNDVLIMQGEEGELRIRLSKLLEATGAFACFQFSPMESLHSRHDDKDDNN